MDRMTIVNPHTKQEKYLVEDGLRVTDLSTESETEDGDPSEEQDTNKIPQGQIKKKG